MFVKTGVQCMVVLFASSAMWFGMVKGSRISLLWLDFAFVNIYGYTVAC